MNVALLELSPQMKAVVRQPAPRGGIHKLQPHPSDHPKRTLYLLGLQRQVELWMDRTANRQLWNLLRDTARRNQKKSHEQRGIQREEPGCGHCAD